MSAPNKPAGQWGKPVGRFLAHAIARASDVITLAVAAWIIFRATDVPSPIMVLAWIAGTLAAFATVTSMIVGSIRTADVRAEDAVKAAAAGGSNG